MSTYVSDYLYVCKTHVGVCLEVYISLSLGTVLILLILLPSFLFFINQNEELMTGEGRYILVLIYSEKGLPKAIKDQLVTADIPRSKQMNI